MFQIHENINLTLFEKRIYLLLFLHVVVIFKYIFHISVSTLLLIINYVLSFLAFVCLFICLLVLIFVSFNFWQVWLSASTGQPSTSSPPTPVQGLRAHVATPRFYMGARNQNSRVHAYTQQVLLSTVSPIPHCGDWQNSTWTPKFTWSGEGGWRG